MFYKSFFKNKFGQMSLFSSLCEFPTALKIVAVLVQFYFECCSCDALSK